MQIIFHIDLNAFYASAEISRNPELEGKPLVISGKSKRSIMKRENLEFILQCLCFRHIKNVKI